MTLNNKKMLDDLLNDLMIEYIEDNNIKFEDNQRWENDEIIKSIDVLRWKISEDI